MLELLIPSHSLSRLLRGDHINLKQNWDRIQSRIVEILKLRSLLLVPNTQCCWFKGDVFDSSFI